MNSKLSSKPSKKDRPRSTGKMLNLTKSVVINVGFKFVYSLMHCRNTLNGESFESLVLSGLL